MIGEESPGAVVRDSPVPACDSITVSWDPGVPEEELCAVSGSPCVPTNDPFAGLEGWSMGMGNPLAEFTEPVVEFRGSFAGSEDLLRGFDGPDPTLWYLPL